MNNIIGKNKFGFVAWGGILTALIILTAYFGTLFAFVEIMIYLSATPVIIAVILGGPRFALMVCAAAAILTSSFFGFFPTGAYFVIAAAPLGILLGIMYSKNSKSSSIAGAAAVMIAISMFIIIYLLGKLMGIDPTKDTAELAQWFNMDPEAILNLTRFLLPSGLLIGGVIYALYIWFFNSWILNKLKLTKKNYITELSLLFNYPEYFGYLYIATIVITLIGANIRNLSLTAFISGFMMLFSLLFFLKGLVSMRPYLFAYVPNPFLRLLLGLLAIILSPITVLIGFTLHRLEITRTKIKGA